MVKTFVPTVLAQYSAFHKGITGAGSEAFNFFCLTKQAGLVDSPPYFRERERGKRFLVPLALFKKAGISGQKQL
jgi:hypothetical protein